MFFIPIGLAFQFTQLSSQFVGASTKLLEFLECVVPCRERGAPSGL